MTPPAELTPYDRGEVLEPRLWVDPNTGITGSENRRPAVQADWGRVDFDDQENVTQFNVRSVPSVLFEQTNILHVELVGNDGIIVEVVDHQGRTLRLQIDPEVMS